MIKEILKRAFGWTYRGSDGTLVGMETVGMLAWCALEDNEEYSQISAVKLGGTWFVQANENQARMLEGVDTVGGFEDESGLSALNSLALERAALTERLGES